MTSYQQIQSHFNIRSAAHIIQNDVEALAVAEQLAIKFKTHAHERDLNRQLPFQEIEEFSQSGLWAITVPKQFGGADVSTETVSKVISIISAVDGSLGQIPQNHFYAIEVLKYAANAEQQAYFFNLVLQGLRFGNALAEYKTKNSTLRQSHVTKNEQGYVISGEKFYCTGSVFAHILPTLVKDDLGREYLAFVPRHQDGVEIKDDWSGFGQKTTGSGTVKFHQVQITARDLIPFDVVFQQPTTVGPFAQILHAAIEVGIAQGALDETRIQVKKARAWVDANVEFAHQDTLTLFEIGRIATDVRASTLLLQHAAQNIDQIRSNLTDVHVAQASLKVAAVRAHSTEIALRASSKLIELAGSRGSQRDNDLDRFWRNARVHTLHDPARWKYYFIGQYELNRQLPPRRGTL